MPEHLIDLEVTENGRSLKHNVLMYDQEPLLKEHIENLILSDSMPDSFKHMQLLGNSEISDFKKIICKEYNYLDFYFFFHGFAALSWYQDYKYFSENYTITKKFIALNHIVTNDRSYRLDLVSKMLEKNILGDGIVSLHATNDMIYEEINNPQTKLSDAAVQNIKNSLFSLKLPLLVDTAIPHGSMSATVGPNEHLLHQKALWHIVTETVFYYPKLHLTEKIFKPIVNRRPFILVASPGNLAYLKKYGFKTFDRWIDESYDQEVDNDKRIQMIINELEKICNLSLNELRDMQQEMQEILEFNFYHFYGEFKKIIIKELLENFKSCVAQWNIGRIDRTIELSTINFPKVEKLLLS